MAGAKVLRTPILGLWVDDSTMRALAWFGNQDVRMIDAPAPAITNVGLLLIFLEKGWLIKSIRTEM